MPAGQGVPGLGWGFAPAGRFRCGMGEAKYRMSERGRFPPEDELLLLLARGSLTPELQERALHLMSLEPSWPSILSRPQTYRILPLLNRHLQTLGFPGVPPQTRTKLEEVCREIAVYNALAARELPELLRLLSAARIPAIPLKGVALAESLYGDLTVRISEDIDILVPRAMVLRAIDVISTRGYRAESARWSEKQLLNSFIEYSFVRRDGPYYYELDLHWGVLWWLPLDKGAVDDLWSEARPGVVLGAPAYTLSPEWEFLFLAAHAARDCWQGLNWLADIQEACARGGIDWQKVWEKARRFEWDEVLELTASVCNYMVGTSTFANGAVRELPPWLKPYILVQQPPFWLFSLSQLHLLKHNSERIRYILHGLFVPTSSDWEFIRLPRYLTFLYYPIRPLRVGFKFVSWIVAAGRRRIFRSAPGDATQT